VPFIAYRDLEAGELVLPQQIEEREDLACPTCEQSMHVVKAHTRAGSQIPQHFRHDTDTGCEGESNEHKHAKYTAAELLHERLPELLDPSISYEIKWEERLHQDDEGDAGTQIDVLARFTPPAPRWGRGLAIEVQHKNKAKEIHGYTREVLGEEISILWVSSERFLRPITQLLDGFDELILGTHPDLERVTQHPQALLDASSWDRYPLIERSPRYHLERIEYTSPELDARDYLAPLREELRARNRDRGERFVEAMNQCTQDWGSQLNFAPGSPHLREIQRELAEEHELEMRVKLPHEYWKMIHLDEFGKIDWGEYFAIGPGDQHEQEINTSTHQQSLENAYEHIEWELTTKIRDFGFECDAPRCNSIAQHKFITTRDGAPVEFKRCPLHEKISKFELIRRSGQSRYLKQ
jgi:hypothetical protein